MNSAVYEDAFNLLCGDKIGAGISRTVFECRLRNNLVVKVEQDDGWRSFANVVESRFWTEHKHSKKIAEWLAPCEYLSPDGRILLQQRCDPVPLSFSMPSKVPAFLSDLKRRNFGLLHGRLVCVDYALTCATPSIRLERAFWCD